jgi:hypothetical protein
MGIFRRMVVAIMGLSVVLVVLIGIMFARHSYKRSDQIDERDLKDFPVKKTNNSAQPLPEHVLCINLPYREDAWVEIQQQFKKHLLPPCERLIATVGHYLPPNLYLNTGVITNTFVKHLAQNPNHRGHLGALFSHKEAFSRMVEGRWNLTLIVEDDVVLSPTFRTDLMKRIGSLNLYDSEWDVLLLGFSCDVGGCQQCERNDNHKEPIATGIVRVGYAIGLWAYLVRDHTVAKKLHDENNLSWMLDHAMNNMGLKMYGCVPCIGCHPGTSRTSAWDYTQTTKTPNGRSQYTSDCTQ